MGLWPWAPVPVKHPSHRFLLLYDKMTTMVRACRYTRNVKTFLQLQRYHLRTSWMGFEYDNALCSFLLTTFA